MNIFIIGGSSLYSEGLLYADTIYLTRIDKEYKCDTLFPDQKSIDSLFKQENITPWHIYNDMYYRMETYRALLN